MPCLRALEAAMILPWGERGPVDLRAFAGLAARAAGEVCLVGFVGGVCGLSVSWGGVEHGRGWGERGAGS
ncbi:MAG: hypothetical protein ACK555_12825, partial [Acidobacteriota bacterium]